jgi:hypothetical protein
VAEGTIRAHVSHLMAKLGLRRRSELIRYAWPAASCRPATSRLGITRLRPSPAGQRPTWCPSTFAYVE